MQCKVTRLCFFGGKRVYPGQLVTLKDEKQFSKEWMEPVGWKPKAEPKPEKK
jgi:hypothetical protein